MKLLPFYHPVKLLCEDRRPHTFLSSENYTNCFILSAVRRDKQKQQWLLLCFGFIF